MKNNKGEFNLTSLAITILLAGICVAIGASILGAMRDSRLTELETYQLANQSTVTTVNETGAYLPTDWISGISTCLNETGGAGTVIESANYTVALDYNGLGSAFIILNSVDNAIDYNNSIWHCTYNVYNTSRADWSLPENASVGIGEYGNWFKIIAITAIAGLILGLILIGVGRQGQGSGTVY